MTVKAAFNSLEENYGKGGVIDLVFPHKNLFAKIVSDCPQAILFSSSNNFA
jgi:hypothetical protein